MKNVYFLSDAHLGSLATRHHRTQERRLVRFLDEIKDHCSALYLLGDMFDFWYEYKYCVPKGYTRFLGKISELTDRGVEVHYFTGNHDLWLTDYFEKECGMIKLGMDADLIMLDFTSPHLMPCHNVLSQLVYAASGHDVIMTMVRGKMLYAGGKFLSIDIDKVVQELAEHAMPTVFMDGSSRKDG